MRLKLDYKMTIETMSWQEYDKEKNYIILCEEFYRLRRECKEHEWIWEESEPMYVEGIDYMALAKNQAAWSTLGRERLRTERALPAQAALADHMGTAGDKVYMVTINYADKYSEFAWMEAIAKNLKEREWVKKIEYVHEYYTDQGNHPHTHIIMTLHKKMTPRRLAESVFAIKGVKKYCEGLNFVQVEKDTSRSWIDRLDYIKGNKRESKHENLLRDIEWRNKNFVSI